MNLENNNNLFLIKYYKKYIFINIFYLQGQ